MQRSAIALFIACVVVAGCGAPRSLVPSEVASGASSFADRASAAGGQANLVLNVVVPAHGSIVAPHANWVSPATKSFTVTTVNEGSHKTLGPVYFHLASTTFGCSGGAMHPRPAALSCNFTLTLPAGHTKIYLSGFAAANGSGDPIGQTYVIKDLEAGTTTHLDVSLGGVPRYVIAWLTNPFPSLGVAGSQALHVLAADAYGYVIVGPYSSRIRIINSDSSGSTTLSRTIVASSDDRVSFYYNGHYIPRTPSMLRAQMENQETPVTVVRVAFDPGYAALDALPNVVLLKINRAGKVQLNGLAETIPPYRLSTGPDPYGDLDCNGMLAVVGTPSKSPQYELHPMQIGACSLSARDEGGHRVGIPVLVQQPEDAGAPTPTPNPSTSPTSSPTSKPTHGPTPTPTSSVPIIIPTPTPPPSSPPVFGTPVFPGGDGSGTCNGAGITLNAVGAVADIHITEPGYTGAFTTKSTNASIGTTSIFDNIVTITAQGAGTATISVSDAANNTSTCNVTVI